MALATAHGTREADEVKVSHRVLGDCTHQMRLDGHRDFRGHDRSEGERRHSGGRKTGFRLNGAERS